MKQEQQGYWICNGLPLIREPEAATRLRVFSQISYILAVFSVALMTIIIASLGGVKELFAELKEGSVAGVLASWILLLISVQMFLRCNIVSTNKQIALVLVITGMTMAGCLMVISGEIKMTGLNPFLWFIVTLLFFINAIKAIAKNMNFFLPPVNKK